MRSRRAIVVCMLIAAPAWAQAPVPAPKPGAAPQNAAAGPHNTQASVHPPAPPALGRLFYTPGERARIDELRRRPAAPPPQVAVSEPPRKLPPPPEYVTLNGIVQRSDGQTTVWLNNRPVRGGRSDEGVVVSPAERAGVSSGVKVTVPQTGRSVDLKVGQQLEVNSGQVQEAYRAPRAPVALAPAPVPDAGSEPPPSPRSEAPRRASRERELLRDLLREVEGPAATKPDPAAQPSGKTP